MTQRILAIWSLVPLPFLKPAWTSGSSRLLRFILFPSLSLKVVWLNQQWGHPVHFFSQHFWQPGSGSLSTLSCSGPPPALSSVQFNKGPIYRLSGRGQELAPVGTRPSGGGGAQKLDRRTHQPVHRPDFQKALKDGIILCRNTSRFTDIENNLIVAKGERWGREG